MAIDQNELEKMRHFVSHHWRQMCNCVWLLRCNVAERAGDRLPPGQWTAWIVSFAMNARTLVDFLNKPKARGKEDSDTRAIDYLPPGMWILEDAELRKRLNDTHDKASKTIAHITTERLHSPHCEQWLLCDVVNDIRAALLEFQQKLVDSGQMPIEDLGEYEHLSEVTNSHLWPRHGGSATNTSDVAHTIFYGSTGFHHVDETR